MKTSPSGVAFIAAHEGIVTRAYRDAAGVWTIGVGHTAAAGPPAPSRGMVMTREEALVLLRRDLPRYEQRVAGALPAAEQSVFDGAVSFDFNTGAIDRATWVGALRRGDAAGARDRLMLWVKAGGRALPGLVRRREAEAALIFDGDYGDTGVPHAAIRAADVASDLASLGFTGADAVTAYQAAHPDLVADGIAGPATRAAIARDLAARRAAGGAVATGVGAAVATGMAAGGGGHFMLVAILVALVAAAALGGFLLWRHGDELRRFLQPKVIP
jgi:lysozyme